MNKERVIQKFKKKLKHIKASRKWGKKRLKEWNEKHKLIYLPSNRISLPAYGIYPNIAQLEGLIEVKPLLCFANSFAVSYKRMIDAKKRRQYSRGFKMRRRNS